MGSSSSMLRISSDFSHTASHEPSSGLVWTTNPTSNIAFAGGKESKAMHNKYRETQERKCDLTVMCCFSIIATVIEEQDPIQMSDWWWPSYRLCSCPRWKRCPIRCLISFCCTIQITRVHLHWQRIEHLKLSTYLLGNWNGQWMNMHSVKYSMLIVNNTDYTSG